MIKIINISPDDAPIFGINDYEVRINDKIICRFQHDRKYGLAECLRDAADAVEKQRREDIFDNFVEFIQDRHV